MADNSNAYQEMAAIISRFATGDCEYSTSIEGLFFNRRSAPTQPIHTTQWSCFAMVIQGEKSLRLGGEEYRYGTGDYLVVSLDLPVLSRVTMASRSRPHLGLGMAIRPEAVREAMRRMQGVGTDLVLPASRGVSVMRAPQSLIDASLRLLRLLDSPKDAPMLAPLIEQEILYYLLTGPAGSQLLQISMVETPGNRIARAVAWLKERYAEPLRIDSLAKHVGMSVSSLHHHFKTVTNMTPLQYQKQLRLHEARRLMLMEQFDVGAAGYSVGYQSPSQFSREYARLYGVSPRNDLLGVHLSSRGTR